MNKSSYKKILLMILVFFIVIFLLIFLIRLINSRELDDVTPGIECQKDLMDKADTLWVIPNYNNFSISENKTWCSYILGLNKSIGMHGVIHEFNEFGTDRNQEYLEKGINIFRDCFNFQPTMFKSPQLKITTNNKELIKENGMKLKYRINQITHKVYHCNDSDKIKNWVIDLF